ncbi:hypothetical protein SUSAZ_02860 [Sulfolobus acidocaldarius SUSAZ]|nr:hypothetical protein SUSAZ_02860 [Sulfolobus acidocaldarius SUSAZ]
MWNRLRVQKRAVELLGYPKLTEIAHKSKEQLYLYVRGYNESPKKIKHTNEIINEVMKALPVDEVVKIVKGVDYTDVTPSDIPRVYGES